MAMSLPDEVRASCARIAARARSVTIDLEAPRGARPGPGARAGRRAPPARRAGPRTSRPTSSRSTRSTSAPAGSRRCASALDHRAARSPATSRSRGRSPTASARGRRGPNDELRAMRTEELADTLGQARDHELMALYAQALRDLGRFLGERHAAGPRRRVPRLGRGARAHARHRHGALRRPRLLEARADRPVEPRARGRRASSTISTA